MLSMFWKMTFIKDTVNFPIISEQIDIATFKQRWIKGVKNDLFYIRLAFRPR